MKERVKITNEREMFLYWLLQAYTSFRRQGWEEGLSIDEICHAIVSVLGNYNIDPNSMKDPDKTNREIILEKAPTYFIASGDMEEAQLHIKKTPLMERFQVIEHGGKEIILDWEKARDPQITALGGNGDLKGSSYNPQHHFAWEYELTGRHWGDPLQILIVDPRYETDGDESGTWHYATWDAVLFMDDKTEVPDEISDLYENEIRDAVEEGLADLD